MFNYKVTGWSNANGGLSPLQAEFDATNLSDEEVIKKGKFLLAQQINDPLGFPDLWLNDVKFWRCGGVTWQLHNELNELA